MRTILRTIIIFSLSVLSFSSFGAIEVAVTVDDLPFIGDLPKGTTRLEIANRMIDAFKKYKIEGVYGFVSGVVPN